MVSVIGSSATISLIFIIITLCVKRRLRHKQDRGTGVINATAFTGGERIYEDINFTDVKNTMTCNNDMYTSEITN